MSSVGEDAEQFDLMCCWQECRMVQPLWKTASQFLIKLNADLPSDPANPLLSI